MELEKLNLSMLKRDKDALRVLATQQGEPVSVIVRQLIRRALQERGLLPEQPDRAEVQHDRSERTRL